MFAQDLAAAAQPGEKVTGTFCVTARKEKVPCPVSYYGAVVKIFSRGYPSTNYKITTTRKQN